MEELLSNPAKKLWKAIPGSIQVKLLNNVWCGDCRTMTGIKVESGQASRGDLILKGYCTKCSGPVARVIEGQ